MERKRLGLLENTSTLGTPVLLQLVVQAEPDGIVGIGRESSASDFPVGELWVVI
jgi:hypothetical protein